MQIPPERFAGYRKNYGLTQDAMGESLGITGKYVGMIERGAKDVDSESPLGLLFGMLENGPPPLLPSSRDDGRPVTSRDGGRMVPVIGWAHAGAQTCYEELPKEWQHLVPTECRDPAAFAVTLEGDSMEPRFHDGDLLILMPSERPYSGCYVVAKFANDGVVFRRMETLGDKIQLVPLNPRHQASQHSAEEFTWIYPVWGRWSQMWK